MKQPNGTECGIYKLQGFMPVQCSVCVLACLINSFCDPTAKKKKNPT